MVHGLIVASLAVGLLVLVQRKLVQIDLFFPWFVALAVLAVASVNPGFVDWLGERLGILYPPIAVIFLVFFLQFGIIISLTVSVTRLRERIAELAKDQALRQLTEQEKAPS